MINNDSLTQFISEAGLQLGSNYGELVRLAADLHEARAETTTPDVVSRTTLLEAARQLEPELAKALKEAGLNHRPWTERFSEPSSPGTASDIEIYPAATQPAIDALRTNFPGAEVDALSLSWAILETAYVDNLEQRLQAAGIEKASDAAKLLRSAVEARASTLHAAPAQEPQAQQSNAPSSKAQQKVSLDSFEPAESDEDPLTPWLAEFAISKCVKSILDSAWDLSDHDPALVGPVTPGLVLIACVEKAHKPKNSSAEWLRTRNESKSAAFAKAAEDYRAAYAASSFEREDSSFLREAREVAQKTSGDLSITARALVGSLLARVDDPFSDAYSDLLESLGPGNAMLRQDFYAYLERSAPKSKPDSLSAWRLVLLLDERGENSRTSLDLERLDGEDHLGIEADVDAFARVIADRDITPPLSIGVFGDWGSGKSFFMRQLREQISSVSLNGDAESGYHQDIVQVEFNAWNYVEANLWASLVTHIFESLNQHFVGHDKEHKEFQALLEKLDEAKQLERDAQELLETARGRLDEAEGLLTKTRVRANTAIRGVWAALGKKTGRFKSDLKQIESSLGGDAIRTLGEEIFLHGAKARDIAGRFAVLRRSTLKGLTSFKSLSALLFVVAACGGALYALQNPDLDEETQRLYTHLAEFLAIVGGASAWVGTALKRASGTLDAIQHVRDNWREAVDGSDEAAELEQARSEVLIAEQNRESRVDEIKEIEQRIGELRPHRRLANFLEARANSSDYRQHLGLPALIRRDFERLHKLLLGNEFVIECSTDDDSSASKRLPPSIASIEEALRRQITKVDTPLGELDGSFESPGRWDFLEKGTEDVEGGSTITRRITVEQRADSSLLCRIHYDGAPSIDRIVLYIDDLDRCPPKRVVEVLQAVHLLLAFPLFVVVVGVDARWVLRSLERHYEDLWQRNLGASRKRSQDDTAPRNSDLPDEENDSLETQAASPHDYLEKIFQIPFWIKPMDGPTTSRFLGELMETYIDTESHGASENKRDAVEPNKGADTENGSDNPPRMPDDPRPLPKHDTVAQEAEGETPAKPSPSTPLSGEPEDPGSSDDESENSIGKDGVDDNQRETKRPRKVRLVRHEVESMQTMGGLVGRSPRATKRFANVYRLLRARLSEGELRGYLGTRQAPGDYELRLVLLATLVGHPNLLHAFLDRLEKEIEPNHNANLSSFVNELKATPAGIEDHRGWREFRDALDLLGRRAKQTDLRQVRRETRRIARYSFRSLNS